MRKKVYFSLKISEQSEIALTLFCVFWREIAMKFFNSSSSYHLHVMLHLNTIWKTLSEFVFSHLSMKNLVAILIVFLAMMINAVLVGPKSFETKIGISQILGFLSKTLFLICIASLLLISFVLYKQLSLVRDGPVSQHLEEPQVNEETQIREESTTSTTSSSTNQDSNFNDAISRINFQLAGEPGFISCNDFSARSQFEITKLTESDKHKFVAILDQFWGHLFDTNGGLVEKAKIIRADVLLGLEAKIDREYYEKRNIHIQPDFTKVVSPSTNLMSNTISSATTELREYIRNSFIYEDKSQIDDYKIVTLVIRASRTQQTDLNTSPLEQNPVYELISPYIQTDSCWAFGPEDIFDKDNETIGFFTKNESKWLVLYAFSTTLKKLLSLNGSSWLFKRKFSYDEGLIGLVASTENRRDKSKESIPECGSQCAWRGDLILCFGLWSIYRVLELLLVEPQPEFWGKFAFLLCRLQGIIEPALLTNRFPIPPCFCFDPAESVSLGLDLSAQDMTGRSHTSQFMRKENVVMLVRKVLGALLDRPVPLGNIEVMLRMRIAISVLKRYDSLLCPPPFRRGIIN